jgi:hypothetical protein
VTAYQGPFPATITSNYTKMLISNTAVSGGGVTNAGTVSGAGVVVASSTFLTGGFVNTKSISGSRTGIGVSASTIQGAIVDSGLIVAPSIGILVNSAVVSGGINVVVWHPRLCRRPSRFYARARYLHRSEWWDTGVCSDALKRCALAVLVAFRPNHRDVHRRDAEWHTGRGNQCDGDE